MSLSLSFCSSGEHVGVWAGSLFALSNQDPHLGPVNIALPHCSILSLSLHPAPVYPRKTSIIPAASSLLFSSSVLLFASAVFPEFPWSFCPILKCFDILNTSRWVD